MKEDIKSMTLPELTTWMSALGEKGFRAKQLYNWMHKNLVSSFDEMTNLSGALKSKLKEQANENGGQDNISVILASVE